MGSKVKVSQMVTFTTFQMSWDHSELFPHVNDTIFGIIPILIVSYTYSTIQKSQI